MNTAVTTTQPKSVLIDMANRFGMEPQAFEATVRATCMKPDKSGKVPTREEFAAFLLVAKEYNLNPLTKEVYAFPAKGGGIVPIVSIDGWVSLINSHKALDGITFVMEHNDEGVLISCTCRIYRKDRAHPIEITEYLTECIRDTDPWKMRHRMLRHKSLIQCARYAFGFSGIYDEDEGERFADMRDITPTEPAKPQPPKPGKAAAKPSPAKPAANVEPKQEPSQELADKDVEDADYTVDGDGVIDEGEQQEEQTTTTVEEEPKLPGDLMSELDDDLASASDEATVEEIWNTHDLPAKLSDMQGGDTFITVAEAIKARHVKRVGKLSNGKN